jgi:RNA polymerase sigma-70 factor (ECF subfamily)
MRIFAYHFSTDLKSEEFRPQSRFNYRMIEIMVSFSDIDQMIQKGQAESRVFAEALVAKYSTYIQRLATSILGDPDEAQDVCQETFIDALVYIGRYTPGTNLKAWLSRIAMNKCQQALRKRRIRRSLSSAVQSIHDLLSRPANPVEMTLQAERDARIRAAINALGEKHRIPVILYYVYDLKVREIATILEIPEGTVSSRLHYAVKKLGDQLRDIQEG